MMVCEVQVMKALEFESKMAGKDRIFVPPELASQIPDGAPVRVILLFDSDDESWLGTSLETFSAAYAEEDTIYEQLIDGPAAR